MRARSHRAALATVIGEGFVGRLTFGMVSFATPLYGVALGLSLSQIGLLISLRTLVVLPFKPLAGRLADRVGVRPVYLGGIAVRTLSAVLLLDAGGFAGLLLVRVLQGVSSAGRDVASLSVLAREARGRVGVHYGWFAGARYAGNVTGAALAGLLIAAAGGRSDPASYRPAFLLVLGLSVVPFVVAWFGLRETPLSEAERRAVEAPATTPRTRIAGPATVGMLVSTSAYMIHGLYPVLATEYAHLSVAQAGVIYSSSAAVFVIAAPCFGWLIDRRGRTLGLALRSLCNVGSSLLYVSFPSLIGLAVARTIDDSGKAAFQPAWASVVAEIAGEDGSRSGRRLGALDTSATIGEAVGPALAMLLWQTGGIFLLFAVRIAISLIGEAAALRVFGEGNRPARSWLRPARSEA